MNTVCIIERVVCDYRKELFYLLHSKLLSENVSLIVCAGHPYSEDGLLEILEELSFGVRLKNRRILGKTYWQKGALATAKNADLVIMSQKNSALVNYAFLAKRWLWGKPKLALWGHGATFQKSWAQPLREWFKKMILRQADWFFTYTQMTGAIAVQYGLPKEKITILNNAIDTISLINEHDKLTEIKLSALRHKLFPQDMSTSSHYPTGVYCGRLTKLKEIPFLLESLQLIHEKIPEFRMIVVGDGIDNDKVNLFCKDNDWTAWVGAIHGLDRVKYLALGDAWLNPGMVGLSILDSFSMGIPLLTTNTRTHSPEISYLQHGVNGLIADHDSKSYADTVVDLLKNKEYLAKLQKGSRDSSKLYSVEIMAENFKDGVMKCLSM